MLSVTRKEIEYLNCLQGKSPESPNLVSEMTRRLEALRRYDQDCCAEMTSFRGKSARRKRKAK